MRNDEVKISLDEDDHFEEKSHPAIIHSLIDTREELLRGVFFGDLPRVLSFLEVNISYIMPEDLKSSLRLAIQQKDQCMSHLLLILQTQQEKRSPNAYHFRLLFACIFHNKPQLFKQLLTQLKTTEFNVRQVMQLYWVALYLKQDLFCNLLNENGLRPLPGVIRLAYFYKASDDTMNALWESLIDDAEKMQSLDSILLNAGSIQTLASFHLPDYIQEWAEEPRDDLEIKPMSSDQLPVLSPSPYPLTIQKLNTLAERQDYMSIMINHPPENSKQFFQFIAKKFMAYALSNNSQKIHVEHIIEWLKCLYGSSITAVQIFLHDRNLVRIPQALHFCLSYYAEEREYSLPLQLLTASYLENKSLEMPAFRALRYLTSISDNGNPDLKGMPNDYWDREELLMGKRIYINTLIQPLTRDRWGNLTQEIVTRLELPAELIFDDFPISVPAVCLQIITDYLPTEEQKVLQIQYPGLKPQSLLLKQIETLKYQLNESQNIINQLQPLLRFPATLKRWFKNNTKKTSYFAGWATSLGGIISFSFNWKNHSQYNDQIVTSPSWQECVNQGYKLKNAFNFVTCIKQAIPEPSIPECNVLCHELGNPPAGMWIWFFVSLFIIFVPFYICFYRMSSGADVHRRSDNIIPDALNNLLDQHYRHSNEHAPLEIEDRDSLGVERLISDLSHRQTGLYTRLESLESKRERPLMTPIYEEDKPGEGKALPMTDLFKRKKKDSIELTTPLLNNNFPA